VTAPEQGLAVAAPALRLVGIRKSYGPTEVLKGVDLEVAPGSVRALVGENGAGKSTLVGVVAGKTTGWTGEYELHGQPVRFPSVRAAQRGGVALIHQETTSLPTLTVAENVLAGRLPKRGGLLRRSALRDQATAALSVLGVELDVDRPASELGPAELQLVDIARALLSDPSVLLLDEPTAALPAGDRERLFTVVRTVAARGAAVVFISHHMNEVFDLCDRITVLRDGSLVADLAVADVAPRDVVQAMVGRDLAAVDARHTPAPRLADEEPRFRARGLRDAHVLQGVDLDIGRGEIVALTGLLGAGQQQVVSCLLGITPCSGEMTLDGQGWKPASLHEAVQRGVAILTEDRKADGLLLDEPITTNLGLASTLRLPMRRYRRRDEQAASLALVEELNVQPALPSRIVGSLSGGNQQKVALGKWLREPRALAVLHEPTRGVDVGAKAVLHERIRRLAQEGTAVLLVSTDLPEVVALAHRAVVLRRGAVVADCSGPELEEQHLLMASAHNAEDGTSTARPVGVAP